MFVIRLHAQGHLIQKPLCSVLSCLSTLKKIIFLCYALHLIFCHSF